MLIYKILLPSEWAEFQAAGRFDGSPFDRDSGFIHCSSRAQLPGTAARVFGEQPQLVVIAIDACALGDAVRWEDAPGGSYPHVYTALPVEAVSGVHHVAGAARVDHQVPNE